MKPKVVCFCGSTRFAEFFMIERWKLEKQGIITLGINILPDGYFAAANHHGAEQEGVKDVLDDLHLRKIDLSDEVVILNVDGYIGESTRRELDYALTTGKLVKYLEPINRTMTLPQPEIYRDYEIIPKFNYKDGRGDYLGKSDWHVFKQDAETGTRHPFCTLEQVKESIDDLLNQ